MISYVQEDVGMSYRLEESEEDGGSVHATIANTLKMVYRVILDLAGFIWTRYVDWG